jgi:amino acid transporter
MFDHLRQILIGTPMPSAREAHERLSKTKGLAVFSSDALSSVAYGTEEVLWVLVLAGTAGLAFSVPIGIAIATLAVIVASSYFQTIHAYPSGGGAYIVAHENLGIWPGLTAAAALQIDYVLTVAVSIAAGVAAMTSAFPLLYHWRVEICLLAIILVMWGNLRGVRESGTIFSIPTYAFIAMMFILIGTGVARLISGQPSAPIATPPADSNLQPLTIFLILRAFASGCTALTGIEAVSNGIQAFKKPESLNAGRTLIAMAALLAAMLLGITVLARTFHVLPTHQETVVSQIGRAVFGVGPLYYALQGATALILVLAANTAFADFPRLASILARDHYIPRQLANRGDRLVFTNGIITLAVLASILVIVFGGRTHSLLPLYAVGVFLSFTLSQTGMVRHWFVLRGPAWRWKAALNGLGMVATGIVTIVIVTAKFIHGAWVVAVLIPTAVFLFRAIRSHYDDVQRQMSLIGQTPELWPNLAAHVRQKVVVPVAGVHRGTLAALQFARTMSTDVTAVTADVEPAATERVRQEWNTWGHDVPLVVLPSPYRSTIAPLMEYLEETDRRDPERGLAVVVIPEFVPARAWQQMLHNQTAKLIKRAILYERGETSKDRILINVPYHLSR